MSEDYISLDIRPSYLEDITDLLEREIEKSDCFEEISHYFAILSDLEEEYFNATAKKNDEYKCQNQFLCPICFFSHSVSLIH